MERFTEVHGGHRARLRQKVRDVGLEALEPHEIIEFLLYYAVPRQDMNALAHRLIDRFGSVGGVLRAEVPDLMQVAGIGRRNAEFLAWVGEVASACAALTEEDRLPITNYEGAFRYACAIARQFPAPCCVQLCLDREARLLYRRALCPSRAWGEAETLRGALNDVLSTRARNVILIEFVGVESAEPEEYDLAHIQDYATALHAADSALLDFVIAGEADMHSLRKRDAIPDFDFTTRARSVREEYMRPDAEDAAALRIQDITPIEEDDDDAASN